MSEPGGVRMPPGTPLQPVQDAEAMPAVVASFAA